MNLEGFGVKTKEKTKATTENFATKEANIVSLKWIVCEPNNFKKGGEVKSNKAVIFLPGVALEADSPSVVESAQDFANASKTITYAISTRTDDSKIKNSQVAQAEVIHQFITNHNLQEVTLVGHSQGANKSMDLAAQLEKAGIYVRGLILTNPAGLYEQDSRKIITNFAKDALVNTAPGWFKKGGSLKAAGRSLQVGASAGANIIKEIVTAPDEFIDRATREADEASALNKSAAEIKAPVVVIFGADDIVFDPKKVILDNDAHELDDDYDKRLESQNKRIEALRKILPNSSAIEVLEATKLSAHGLHYSRSQTVANASVEMLNRIEKSFEVK